MSDDATPVLDQVRAARRAAQNQTDQPVDDPWAGDPAFDSDFYEDR